MISVQEAFEYAGQQFKAGNRGVAEQVYCRIIAEHEDNAHVLLALGTLYACSNAPGRAITFLKRGLQFLPNHAGANANIAAVYRQLGRKDMAMEYNQRALALAPGDAMVMSNISGLYVNAAEPEKAIYWADKALAVAPEMPEPANHRAIALLEQGNYRKGWSEYDARLRIPGFHRRPYECPMWTGEKVHRLAIHGEQGLGDEIMFLTLYKQAKELADEIAIECSPRLVTLIQSSFPEAKVFGCHEDLIAAFTPDAYIAMGSLPRLLWPVKPNAYLRPSNGQQYRWPDKGGAKRIGISWYGGTHLTHRELRNTVIDEWRAFLDLDAEFISLQYGEAGGEAKELGIAHDAEAIADLDRLAALISTCDLVISVCNTTIHMAGALGVPCIVLTPTAAAWRYGLKGERMVWYDSPRMVRQGRGESWASVFQRAKVKCADYGYVPRTQPQAA